MKWITALSLSFFTVACSSHPSLSSSIQSPLELLPAKPAKGKLFTYYQPKDSSKRENNWTAGLDFTGISWNEATCATLISPSHVVMAAHFMRSSGSSVMFHNRLGQPEERFIVAYNVLSSVGDVAIGKLNLPLPKDYKYYRFASAEDAKIGTPVIVTDQTMTASIHEIAAVNGRTIGFNFNRNIDPIYQRNLIVGDSGHPSFLLKNGELLLLETHTYGGGGSGPFYGNPEVQAAIRKAVAEMGP